MDNYLIWLLAVEYIMEELGLEKKDGKELYEEALLERNKLLYDSVQLQEEN